MRNGTRRRKKLMPVNLRALLPRRMYNWLRLVRIAWFPFQYEPKLHALLLTIIRPGWVCVDVGANIGIITCSLATMVGPTGRVFAFEAFPENARDLAKLAKWRNVAARVIVENIAVSDGSTSEIALFPGRGSASEEWNILGHDLEGNQTEAELRVRATSLDDYFPAGALLHFVKIDIEGAEALALCGMRRILRESRPLVFIEFHDEDGWKGREELFAAQYSLYDVTGRKLDPAVDTARVYHCLACPAERALNISRQP
jgi:FkbM family methyltransferase